MSGAIQIPTLENRQFFDSRNRYIELKPALDVYLCFLDS
jgi:hypothetical protein